MGILKFAHPESDLRPCIFEIQPTVSRNQSHHYSDRRQSSALLPIDYCTSTTTTESSLPNSHYDLSHSLTPMYMLYGFPIVFPVLKLEAEIDGLRRVKKRCKNPCNSCWIKETKELPIHATLSPTIVNSKRRHSEFGNVIMSEVGEHCSKWSWAYLYKALLANVRKCGHIALATASSGVAANNMPGGRTAHSRFKIPLNLENNSVCNVKKQSGTAQLLRIAKLIIWGLPPHYLRLKVGCPVILLRNIDPGNGLCNGTRLICRSFQPHVIDAEIAVGQHAGKMMFLPRIPLSPSDDDMFPFKLRRKQFPVRLCFAMTINKAQG
ncbi:hypothetical protein LXL04_017206 [Taraxacum kok-saghyz]